MIIIGEKPNSSIPSTLEAMRDPDGTRLKALILRQAECGAEYIDINTALLKEQELEKQKEFIELVIGLTECKIMLDSPDPDVLEAALGYVGGRRKVIINSINCDGCGGSLAGFAAENGAGVVLMPMKNGEIPQSAEERLKNAELGVGKLIESGLKPSNIYVDAIVQTAAAEREAPKVTLETIRLIKENLPSVNIIAGLSNVSFGLPKRANMNAAFFCMAAYAGLSAVICDPVNPLLRLSAAASDAILGEDEFCIGYIGTVRDMDLI